MKPESDSAQLVTQQESQLAQAHPVQPPSVGAMLQAVIDKGISTENVGALEKLVDLYERMEIRNAEKAFNSAFVALQQDLPTIVAESVIPNRGKYQRYEDLMRDVGPLLVRHGFSTSFTQDYKENRVTVTCHLRHVEGHSEANAFSVRVSGKADSETQADSKASTTARRNAFIQSLNLVIRQDALLDEDQDASIEGAFLKVEQVLYLKELVKSTASDEKAFLAFAGASKYEEITVARYDRLVAALHKKASGA